MRVCRSRQLGAHHERVSSRLDLNEMDKSSGLVNDEANTNAEVRIIMEIVATRLGDWSQVDNKPKDELLLALVKQRMWE